MNSPNRRSEGVKLSGPKKHLVSNRSFVDPDAFTRLVYAGV
jgi:hypothetical protein